MASAWQTISSDRRSGPRHMVRLRASVSVLEAETGEGGATVLAHTRDISRDGLCLVMPTSRIGSFSLGEGSRAVLVVLVLPSGDSVNLEGRLAYCIPLESDEPAAGCLAGVRITGLAPGDGAAYYDFIDGL